MSKAADIIAELQRIVGDAYVLTGSETAKWATDWTGTYVSDPIAVTRPACAEDISAIVKLANSLRFPVVPVSGNTGVTGGTSATGAVILSLDRLNTIREIEPNARVAVVEAGVILATLQAEVADYDLSFPLSFGAQGSAMIGGCLATNAGGSNVLRYGNARDLCLGIEVVRPDGEIIDVLSKLHKDNTGYSLKHLMIGSEGTLGIITAAALKLFPKPKAHATAMVATADLDQALVLLNKLQDATAGAVEAFEYMPRSYIDAYLAQIPNARAPFDAAYDVNILVEVAATAARDTDANDDGSVPLASYLLDVLEALMEEGAVLDAVLAANDTQRQEMWARREVAIELARAHPYVLPNDIALPLDAVSIFLTEAEERLCALDPDFKVQIVAHLGDGNIHYAIHPSVSDTETHARMTSAVEELVADLGGCFSAEHGIGLAKRPLMARRKSPNALNTMDVIKKALDPNGILNPGKVIPD